MGGHHIRNLLNVPTKSRALQSFDNESHVKTDFLHRIIFLTGGMSQLKFSKEILFTLDSPDSPLC